MDYSFNTDHPSRIHYIYIIALVAALSGLLFGYDTGVISGAILFINAEFHLSTFATGFFVSSVLFAACISAAISGRFADFFGRRRLLWFNGILFLLGSIGGAIAPSFFWLLMSRLVIGCAIGISSYVAPLYISEIAPFRRRGVMVGFNQLCIVTGILISFLIDYLFSHGGSWRLMLGVGTIPAALLLIGLSFVPESPRWLIANFREENARDILHSIRAPENNIEVEILEIRQNVDAQREDWRMLLRPWLIPALIVGFGIAIFQQLVGINIFIYYGPTVFKLAGFQDTTSALLATLGVGLLLEFFTLLALPLIDKWGRRPLLLLGSIGMTISFLFLSLITTFFPQVIMFKWLVLSAAILYISSFAVSFGPIGWLIIAEVFPLRVRGLASSLATATIWGFDMLVILTFLPLMQLISTKGIFLGYGILCLLSLFFVYFFVPETKGVTLEHIETKLRLGNKSRDLGA